MKSKKIKGTWMIDTPHQVSLDPLDGTLWECGIYIVGKRLQKAKAFGKTKEEAKDRALLICNAVNSMGMASSLAGLNVQFNALGPAEKQDELGQLIKDFKSGKIKSMAELRKLISQIGKK